MAVRIRKLAKELNRSVPEVIGILHALGMSRYRSADDMLPSAAEERVRKGVRSGVRPVPVEVDDVDVAPSTPPPRTPADDLMARLVPGVVRVGEAPKAPSRGESPLTGSRVESTSTGSRSESLTGSRGDSPLAGSRGDLPLAGSRGELPRGAPRAGWADAEALAPSSGQASQATGQTGFAADGDWRALQAERAAIESLRRGLESERAVVAAERAEVEEDRRSYEAQVRALDGEREALSRLGEALHVERSALEVEREALMGRVERQRQRTGATLQELLEERGLRGSDEFERSIIALAQSRLLREAIWTFRVDSPEVLRKLLSERLVLVDGAPAEAISRAGPTVVVASERAEVPGAAALGRMLANLGEAMLLNGMRRVVLVGGRPTWHRVLREGLDPRLDLRSVAAKVRDAIQASTDVVGADLVVLWGVELVPAARAVYTGSRAVVIEVHEGGVGELIQTVITKLQE